MPKFSVNKPYTVVVAMIIVVMLGIISFMNMTTDLLPSFDLPYVLVMTTYPGASPEEVEESVVKPLERSLATTSNIKNITSISRENAGSVILEFYQGVNMDSTIIEINGTLDMMESQWSDNIQKPMVMKINPDALPILIAAYDHDGLTAEELTKEVEEVVVPSIERIEGVAAVEASGLFQEEVRVTLDQDKIDDLNDRILEAVDSELADVKEQLDDAKSQLESGKEELQSQSEAGSIQMGEAGAALTDGKITVSQKESEINSAITVLEANKTQLEGLLANLRQQEQDLLAQKAQLEAGALPTLPPEATPDPAASPAPEPTPAPTIPPAVIDQAALAVVTESLTGVQALIQETEAALATVNEQLSQLRTASATLQGAKNQIKAGEEQLIEGEAAMTSGVAVATSELTAAEIMLKSQEMEFERARDQALENANIDGVVTPQAISQILMAQNFAMPAGYISVDKMDYLVKVGDKIADTDELATLPLMDFGLDEIGTVRLDDVADISWVNNSGEMYAKINGNDGIVLTMQKQSMYSTADVSGTVWDEMNRLMAENEGMHFTKLMDQGDYINIVVDNVINNLLYGGILAVIILFLFLRSIKPTIVVAVSIPLSVVFALVLMYFSGVTLNVISLAGLALGVGMLVDNSIVVIENIYRMRAEGLPAKEAAIEGARQVSGAIIASTLTTVCVFLPIVFVQGISRDLFTDMGLTIAYSLLASLIIALSLVPSMSAGVLKNTQDRQGKWFTRFREGYGRFLAWTLKHKAVIILPCVGLLALGLYNIPKMGTAFIPEMDSTQISVTLELPQGSTLDDTKEAANQAVEKIMAVPDVQTIGALAGSGAEMMGMGSDAQTATLYVILSEDKERSSQEVADLIREATSGLGCDVYVNSSAFDVSAMLGSGLEVEVRGPDMDTLQTIAGDVAQLMRDMPGTVDVSDGMEDTVPELRVVVDKEKAIEHGLTVAQVYTAISSYISEGDTATTLELQNNDYPVVVVSPDSGHITADNLANMEVESSSMGAGIGAGSSAMSFSATEEETGGTEEKEDAPVLLKDIATIEEGIGMSAIQRDAQERYISVTAGVDSDHNIGLVSREFSQVLADTYVVPDGYTVQIKGENQSIMDAIGDLIYMLGLAVGLVYLIMVAQFQSLLSPFIVMFTIPLAYTGGLLALQIGGFDLSVIALLGFLILTGIVVNNGIVLIDYINQLRRQGMSRREAIVAGAKTRIRPILMTALTTIFGLFTLAMGVGTGADMLQPMAVVTIFGLSYATLLTLFFIPILYDIFQKKELKPSADLQEQKVLDDGEKPGLRRSRRDS